MAENHPTPQDRPVNIWTRCRTVLDAAATIGILVVCVVILWDRGQRADTPQPPRTPVAPAVAPLPEEPIEVGEAASRGDPAAPVGLLIFSDFQCPFCQRFATDTLPSIDSEYVTRGKVRLLQMHLPLDRIHPQAFRAAEAAECARRQGQFWPYHDGLFAAPSQLDDDSLLRRAEDVRLDREAFQTCLRSGSATKVRSEQQLGARLGITGTPAFIIGRFGPDGRLRATGRISGARPLAEFQAAFDAALPKGAGPSTN